MPVLAIILSFIGEARPSLGQSSLVLFAGVIFLGETNLFQWFLALILSLKAPKRVLNMPIFFDLRFGQEIGTFQ